MKLTRLVATAAALLALLPLGAQEAAPAAPATPAASPAPAALKTLAVAKVKATPAILTNASSRGSSHSMERVSQALDGQLISAIQQTRKFTVLARSDADALIEEAGATGKAFSYGSADLLLVITVDDFQDFTQTATFAAINKTATKRVIRLSAVGKIYEAKTNKLLETANFQEQNLDSEEALANSTSSGGELSDSLLVAITRRMSEKISQRVADSVYPARVVAKTGKLVTINRGDGTGIAVGQLWEVYALGEEMKDPDTGVSLGREELPVAKVRITRVNASTAQGEINGEDLGLAKGSVIRRVQD